MSDLYEKLRSSGLLLPPDGVAGSHPPPPVRREPALPVIRLNIRDLKMYGEREREREREGGERESERERGGRETHTL